jgi:hypothetical protein
MEIKDVGRCAFMSVTDSNLLTVDFADLAKRQQERRQQMDEANPRKAEPVRVEYNRLRQQQFNLQQTTKGAEVFCNNKADAVKGLEQRINTLLTEKKQAIAAGHLGQERKCEHQIQLLETELIDAKEEFSKAKHWSTQAARALKEFKFNQQGRIEELKAVLDAPLPTK